MKPPQAVCQGYRLWDLMNLNNKTDAKFLKQRNGIGGFAKEIVMIVLHLSAVIA